MHLFRYVIVLLSLIAFQAANAQQWTTDFESARAEAKASGKNVLLVFSGSDWCAPCIKLDKQVWQSDAFKQDAPNWILVKADFPKKKANALSAELTQANAKLCEAYNREGNFPLVVVFDASGKMVGKTGYLDIPASDYIAKIHAFLKS